MRQSRHNRGVVLLMVVFIAALLSVLIVGMLQINTEDVQIVWNQVHAAEALAVAEAGLNDALAQLRNDDHWSAGFASKPFFGGTYTVTVNRSRVTSVGTSAQGFVATIEAQVTVDAQGPPHVISIASTKVNQ